MGLAIAIADAAWSVISYNNFELERDILGVFGIHI
jgi:hypothetical protein